MPDALLRNRDLMEIYLPILRADLAVMASFVYREAEPLRCPITASAAVDDPGVRVEEVAAWEAQTRAEYRLRTFTGGHLFLRANQDAILREIGEAFSSAAEA